VITQTCLTSGFATAEPVSSVLKPILILLYCEGGEALDQLAQGSCGCPITGSVQGQVWWGFEQPGLVEGGRGVGLGDL